MHEHSFGKNEINLAHKKRLMQILKNYVPPKAVEFCADLIMKYNLHLHIEIERKDRLGDYHPHLGKGNRISINHNLNPYDFLITFAHELAHHITYKKMGTNHQAHGPEWKEHFKQCMRPLVLRNIFPPDVLSPLIHHMKHPKYTHSGDIPLMKALMKYDPEKSYTLLDDLPEGMLFQMGVKSRNILKKGKASGGWFLCTNTSSGKQYKVHALAKITRLPSN